MQKGETSGELRLFLNSIPSSFTRRNYKVYLDKYLKTVGVKDVTELLSKSPKEIEDQLIEFIISLKEQGCKSTTIVNYVRPVVGICQLMDKFLNVNKIRRFIPPKIRNKKTRGYEIPEIQQMLDIADERMRVIILTLSSSGMRLNGLTGLTLRNLKSVNNDTMYQITVYENEPEEFVTFCSSECRAKGIDPYLEMRRRYGEEINDNSPLIREQFDKRDPFAAAHPKPITDIAISLKLMGLAESTGLRTRTQLEKGQKGASQRKEIPLTNGFRRYFSTTLVNSKKVPSEHRFLMEGHNLKFNDMSYVHVSNDDLLQSYLLAHDNLLIDQSHKLAEEVRLLTIEKSKVDIALAAIEEVKRKVGLL